MFIYELVVFSLGMNENKQIAFCIIYDSLRLLSYIFQCCMVFLFRLRDKNMCKRALNNISSTLKCVCLSTFHRLVGYQMLSSSLKQITLGPQKSLISCISNTLLRPGLSQLLCPLSYHSMIQETVNPYHIRSYCSSQDF